MLALSFASTRSCADFTEGEYTYTVTDGKATITDFNHGFVGELSVTNTLGGYPVTRIGIEAFSWCQELTDVMIPDSVTSIGPAAFCYSGLTSITLPSDLTHIEVAAFYWCCRLASVEIPNGVTHIESYLFEGCHSLTNITLPDSVSSIGDSALRDCGRLTRVEIPDSVTGIGGGAFTGSGLTSITIPASVTTIGLQAFWDCVCLARVYFSGNAPRLGTYVFLNCPCTVYYLPGTTNWGSTFGDRPTLCWNPTVQADTGFGFAADRFGFNIASTSNIPIAVQATTNLASGVWTPVTNAMLGSSGALFFSDPSSTNLPARYYRIVWP